MRSYRGHPNINSSYSNINELFPTTEMAIVKRIRDCVHPRKHPQLRSKLFSQQLFGNYTQLDRNDYITLRRYGCCYDYNDRFCDNNCCYPGRNYKLSYWKPKIFIRFQAQLYRYFLFSFIFYDVLWKWIVGGEVGALGIHVRVVVAEERDISIDRKEVFSNVVAHAVEVHPCQKIVTHIAAKVFNIFYNHLHMVVILDLCCRTRPIQFNFMI